jgi:hypothetical protein
MGESAARKYRKRETVGLCLVNALIGQVRPAVGSSPTLAGNCGRMTAYAEAIHLAV